MNRRDFIRLGASVPLAAGVADFAAAQESKPKQLSAVDAFNYVIGTQTIGPAYQFTRENALVETAQAILGMGSNILKFAMGPNWRRYMLHVEGKPAKNAAADAGIHSLVDLAEREPAHRRVFEMPFAYYLIWTYAFTPGGWRRGFSRENQEKEYREMFDFAAHLLKTFNGTGKTFYLGHWEGDWHLRPHQNPKSDDDVTPESVQGMADWLNARQRAIDDAKRQIPHEGVELWNYTEVNLVTAVSMEGRPSVTNSVLPRTNVDFVSYSSYDSLDRPAERLPKALDYIERKLPAKKGIDGRRVFLGEYGFPACRMTEAERERRSREVMRVGLDWGCPFVLSWEMYNNEIEKGGRQRGFWLIDDRGVKQPLWHTHRDFYQKARRYVADFWKSRKRIPTAEEYCLAAVKLLDVAS
jgi:hypothetical protein